MLEMGDKIMYALKYKLCILRYNIVIESNSVCCKAQIY